MKSLPATRFTFFVVAGVTLASLALTWWTGRETLRHNAEIASREAGLREVQEYFSLLQDAETGQRGFLLTRRPQYLQPCEEAFDVLEMRQQRLRVIAASGEIPPSAVEELITLSNAKMDELRRSLVLAGKGGDAALDLVLSDEGIHKMDEIRDARDRLVAYEETLLSAAKRRMAEVENLRAAVFVAVALVNLGFLAWAFRRIRREVNRRYVADLESERHREILAVSLASIGDAVILTDTTSRIIYLNEVAEQLTGWTKTEALGRECASVFRIIDEVSRAPVESPADLVLRSGKTIGLANHTILIRKDGSEIPIDDSGAPIREPDGAVRGVALVFRDFSAHKAAERELRRLKDEFQAASQTKDEFLAALSHELRTPLTPVLATLSSWKSRRELPESLAPEIDMLCRNIALEVRLIDDLLDLTRITRGQITLQRETVNVHQMLDEVAGWFRDDVEARGIRLSLRKGAARPLVDGDSARMQQVFRNIVGNAVKFIPQGGRIEIVTSDEGGALCVAIADNGPGFPAGAQPKLFHPFVTSGDAPHYPLGGLAIGLAISRTLVEAHGGTLEAHSAGEGLGAIFLVQIPALEGQPAKPENADETWPRSLAILLVEDHEDTASVVGRIVRNMGHEVVIAGTMDDALTQLRSRTFDLALSDIGLPDGTGIELLTQARAFTPVPMIALTGYGSDEDLARYREAGFAHQLTKPIPFEQLEKLLREFASASA